MKPVMFLQILAIALVSMAHNQSAQAAIIVYEFEGGGDGASYYERYTQTSNSKTITETSTNVTGTMSFGFITSPGAGISGFVLSTFTLNEYDAPASQTFGSTESVFDVAGDPLTLLLHSEDVLPYFPLLLPQLIFSNKAYDLRPLTFITIDDILLPTSFDPAFGTLLSLYSSTRFGLNNVMLNAQGEYAELKITSARVFVDGVEYTGRDGAIATAPAPASLALLGMGLLGLTRRRAQRATAELQA